MSAENELTERLRFLSGVLRTEGAINASDEVLKAAAEIVRLRGEVAYDRELIARMLEEYADEACPSFTIEAIRAQRELLVAADNADAAGVHTARRTLAPAEAKGDWPECSGNPMSCPENEGHGCCKNTPQPADGEAVACGRVEIRGVTADDPGYVHLVGDYMQLNRARQAGHGALLYTHPPAAQVQGEASRELIQARGDVTLTASAWGRKLAEGSATREDAAAFDDAVERLERAALAAHPSACELGAVRALIERWRGWIGQYDTGDEAIRDCIEELENTLRIRPIALQHRGDSQEVGRG